MTDNMQLQMNEYLPLRDVVFQTLRQAILRGTLQPGERLMEIHLAQKLGVSRTPVREAVRKLESEGYVVMIPRKGTYVASLSIQDVNDVFEIRSALEGMAAYYAALRASEEEIQQVKDFVETGARLWETSDLARTVAEDIQFHSML